MNNSKINNVNKNEIDSKLVNIKMDKVISRKVHSKCKQILSTTKLDPKLFSIF